ncbi:hypothetical protein EDD15DRAFT_2516474 [Pisolithus albus]|nr:hypothetical protein EDD15DRAFT_2516474 [Pisolithus albus]
MRMPTSLQTSFLCLSTAVLAQAQQSLPLNSLSTFSGSSIPNSATFGLPASSSLTVSVAICSSQASSESFLLTNGSDIFEIELESGFGSWTGPSSNNASLLVDGAGQSTFEVAVSDNGALILHSTLLVIRTIHEILDALPLFGDSSANQAILFSPPFAFETMTNPTYPNYTLPPANSSLPEAPPSPTFDLVLAPLSARLTSLPQTGSTTTPHYQQQHLLASTTPREARRQKLGSMPPTDTPPGTAKSKTPVTRVNTRATSQASFKDPLATQTTTVTDHATGLRYLLKKEIHPAGIDPTVGSLTTALFLVAQLPNVPASAIDGVRAVAFLLEKVGATKLMTEIENTLRTTLSETITNHVVAAISPHIASIQDSALTLKQTVPLASPKTSTPNGIPPGTSPDPTPTQPPEPVLPHIQSIHSTVNSIHEKMPILEAIHKHLVVLGCGDTLASIGATLDRAEMLADDVGAGLSLVTETPEAGPSKFI